MKTGTHKQGRYRFAQLRREWNRLASKEHQIDDYGYEGLKEYAARRHASTGHRRLEIGSHQSEDGWPHTLEF